METVEPCHVCMKITNRRCRRCNLPTCTAHLDSYGICVTCTGKRF